MELTVYFTGGELSTRIMRVSMQLPATCAELAHLQQEAVRLNAVLRLDRGGRLCARGAWTWRRGMVDMQLGSKCSSCALDAI
jgi:hypothetical protein